MFGRLILPDYHPFVPIVAKAYIARPMYQPDIVYSWKILAAHNARMFQQIQSRIRIEFVPKDPYTGGPIDAAERMMHDIRVNRRLQVWTGASEHGVWTPQENWQFRAVHDYMTHFAGRHAFTLRGEMSAYNRHIKTLPPGARPALFTEVVGQVCTQIFTGKFPPQKIAELYGFDYVNVGRVHWGEYERNFRGARRAA